MTPELLRNVAVFVEVAKASSFSRAASALELPKSTVSRRIAELERDAGIRLFTRSTQKVALTEEGATYYLACCRLMEDANASYDQLLSARHRPRGLLRVAATTDFGARLVQGLPGFCARFPDLHLEFDFTTRRVDPFTDSCDVAIHIGVPPDSNLTARKLADVAVHVFAAPAYLASAARIRAPADLSSHRCILETRVHRVGVQNVWALTDGKARTDVEVHGALSFNSIGIIRRLALSGAGLALLPRDICIEDLEAGRLVRVLPQWRAPVLPIYALTATRLMPAKTRVFLDFVGDTLAAA
ncbi:MAG: LysR family transcriptional regulator [Polaromonas sp.]|nr:LysR family transcriptional regulator [Polaromonas sp.]